MLLRLETATSARISLLAKFCFFFSSKNVLDILYYTLHFLGQLAGFLFCFYFFKRRRCAISNPLCKTLDGKCPAVRFGRMNNRPMPTNSHRPFCCNIKGPPESPWNSNIYNILKIGSSFLKMWMNVNLLPDKNLCLRFDIQRTSFHRRWWRWCPLTNANLRTVCYRWWAHRRLATSWVEHENLKSANF
jgi:hypothetical protein